MSAKDPIILNVYGFPVIIEETEMCWGACSPELPGVGCIGETEVETVEYMQEAVLQAMRDRIIQEKHRTVIRGTGINPAFVASLVGKGYTESSLSMSLGITVADVKSAVFHCAKPLTAAEAIPDMMRGSIAGDC